MAWTGKFTIVGRRYLAEFLRTDAYNHPLYLAWGSGTTTLSAYDTKLSSEKQRAQPTIVRTGDYVTITHMFTVTSATAGTVGELGLFDAASGGIMYLTARQTPETKTAGQVISINMVIQVTQT